MIIKVLGETHIANSTYTPKTLTDARWFLQVTNRLCNVAAELHWRGLICWMDGDTMKVYRKP